MSYRRNSSLLWRRVGSSVVILNPDNGDVQDLHGELAALWCSLDGATHTNTTWTPHEQRQLLTMLSLAGLVDEADDG